MPLLVIEKKYLNLALNKMNELSSKFNYIELKGVESFSKDRLNNTSFYRSENLSNCIELNKFTSYNNYLSSLSSNVRRKVNKATSIFEVITDKNLETFEHLGRLISYSKLKHGAPVYPEEFLINIYNLVPQDNYDIYLGKYNKEFVSAIIIFKFNEHHIYYTGGSIQDHESSKYYCNYLLFNKAIENAFNQRAKIFDFGTSPKNHHSLIEFKKKWQPVTNTHQSLFISNHYINPIAREGILSSMVAYTLKSLPVKTSKYLSKRLLLEAL